jgi:hypothetical protein
VSRFTLVAESYSILALKIQDYFPMSQSSTPIDNPARRLHVLLSQLSKADRSQSAFFSLPQALNIEDWPSFYKLLGKILMLIEETEFKILSLDPRIQDAYSKTLAEIREHLSIIDWNQPWGNMAIPFHDSQKSSLLRNLEICAFALEGKDKLIDSQDLAQLRKSVEDLLQDILSSTELSPELKFLLLEKLREIQRAIDNYTFFGSEGLRKTIESVIGAASIFGAESISQDQEIRDEENPLIKKFWEITRNTVSILSLINNIEKITPVIQNAVPAVQFLLKAATEMH